MSSTSLNIGSAAPDFTLPSTKGEISLSDFRGQKVILYFYPKDDTPGCTQEACDFQSQLSKLNKIGAEVIGVSKDSLDSHEKFARKHELTFALASDESSDVCEKYGVWVEKSMYGKKYWGVQRATFLINEKGKIEHIWPKVKVESHVDEILSALKNSQAA